ncbi:MAG TPA: hypothetical protein VNX40_12505 [Mucilaginibacter sp.]|nr:hypothetical protein [Mucilaginibacter sp.]
MRKFSQKSGFVLLLLIAAVLGGCKATIKRKADLITYVNSPGNGLQKTQEAGKVKATLTYQPWQLRLAKVNQKDGTTPPAGYEDKLYFVLALSADDKEVLRQLPISQYSEMVQVLAFRMQEFISLMPDGGKPLQPLDCLFQQTYGMGTANNLLIVFNSGNMLDAEKLRVQVREFGLGIGNLDFEFKTKDINNIPAIAINQ